MACSCDGSSNVGGFISTIIVAGDGVLWFLFLSNAIATLVTIATCGSHGYILGLGEINF